jgi:sortase (surface protein transpeptidase)
MAPGLVTKRRCTGVVLALTFLVACSSAGAPSDNDSASASKSDNQNSDNAGPPAGALEQFRSARHYEHQAAPIRVRIPRIGVSSGLQRLGLNRDGTIEIPSDWDTAGWYAGGAKPGQPGPAVILGHVDSKVGPAVFYRLRELRAGDRILVDQSDGDTAEFVVKRIQQIDKNRFPTDDVYFPTLKPMLSLVTCGGAFDTSVGHYRDNIIVYASSVP